jgi:NitT/TauT family transport system substrate-binding protein
MTDVLTRREVLASAAALVVAGSSPALAQSAAPDTVRLGKSVFEAFAFATADVGVDAGIWKANNINLEISAFKGDAQLQQALAAGSLDIGLGGGPAMAYRSKGVPAIAVAVMAGRPQDMAILVAPNSTIKSLSGLKGKTIGVTTAGSLTDWLSRQVSAQQGWGPDGVTIAPMGTSETRVTALNAGQIAATIDDVTDAYEIERVGKGKILALFGDIVKDFDTHIIFASDQMVAQRPAVLQRFLRGWFQTVAYMRAHRDVAVKTAARIMHVDELSSSKSYPAIMAMMSNDGAFTQAALDEVRKSVQELGIYDQPLEPKNMYTTRFVPVKL